MTDLSLQTDFELTPLEALTVKGVAQGRYASTLREHIVTEDSNQAEAYRANQTQIIAMNNPLLFK